LKFGVFGDARHELHIEIFGSILGSAEILETKDVCLANAWDEEEK